MPGPISDSYDPEFGTATEAGKISKAVSRVYERLTEVLDGKSPILITDLVRSELGTPITATLSEKEWRLLRFACERAQDSI